MQISLYRSETYGGIEAYTCDLEDENWQNYLDEMGLRSAVIDAIAASGERCIGVLQDIRVYEGYRNLGHGNALMSDLMNDFEDQGAEIIVVFADLLEDNDFDLEAWYEDFGFERVDRDKDAPFMMIASEELLAEVKAINGFVASNDTVKEPET